MVSSALQEVVLLLLASTEGQSSMWLWKSPCPVPSRPQGHGGLGGCEATMLQEGVRAGPSGTSTINRLASPSDPEACKCALPDPGEKPGEIPVTPKETSKSPEKARQERQVACPA